jgi:hypothetical protein
MQGFRAHLGTKSSPTVTPPTPIVVMAMIQTLTKDTGASMDKLLLPLSMASSQAREPALAVVVEPEPVLGLWQSMYMLNGLYRSLLLLAILMSHGYAHLYLLFQLMALVDLSCGPKSNVRELR